MTLPLEWHWHSLADYYRIENESAEKHEFHDGEILAMSGGSPDHSLIAMNTGTSLTLRLRGGNCRVYDSNLRVRISGAPRCCYPDLTVICGPVVRDPEDKSGQAVTNPRVIIEVLSASTEAYDRGGKFNEYRAIASFSEYVLIHQSRPHVEIRRRETDGSWSTQVCEGIEASARIESLGIELPLNEIYVGAEFPVP
jgi:Uma2 family endonuclease